MRTRSLMTLILPTIPPIDHTAEDQARARQDTLTKPPGSLGRLEGLSIQIAGITGSALPSAARKAVIVMAGDHGVTAEGVSAYPAEVTAQMVHNFATGGAAINVLARQAGARVVLVDMGTKSAVVPKGVRDYRLGPGTANMTRGPAMSHESSKQALETGIRLAEELRADGTGLIAVGE